MQIKQALGRQRGQMMIVLALSITALLGAVGLAVDFGFGYAHRREVQNAADAGALAGALALSRQYEIKANNGLGVTGLPPRASNPYTDAVIRQEIINAAAMSVPPFPTPTANGTLGTNLTWPNPGGGGTNTLQHFYMNSDGSQGAAVGGGSIPNNAAGIRVVATQSYGTFFSQVLGSCCTKVDVTASARAMLRPVAGFDGGGPFIVCGGDGSDGAWIVASPTPSHIGTGRQIVDTSTSPATVLSTYIGDTLQIHDPQLGQHDGDCGSGNNFKGNADPDDTCNPMGTTPLPCLQADQNGSRAGPTRNRVASLPGCGVDDDTVGCIVILPISQSCCTSGQHQIVAFAPFRVSQSHANAHRAVLLGAALVDGQLGGVFNPNAPGSFGFRLESDG
jgi:hypothetical protein